MNADIIKSAATKLELLNIVLHEAQLARNPEHENPSNYPASIVQQNKLVVEAEEATYQADSKRIKIFRVYVSLGKRAVEELAEHTEQAGQKKAKIFFTVEATFRVDYLMKAKLTEEEIREFSQNNAVHNVWPFWREHVYEVARKAELPRLSVPLMRMSKKSNHKQSSKSKKNVKKSSIRFSKK